MASCFDRWSERINLEREFLDDDGKYHIDPDDPRDHVFFYRSPEWQEERKKILLKWNGKCERCGRITGSPHIHHLFGIKYDATRICCSKCHSELHDNPTLEKKTFCKFCGREVVWKKQKAYDAADRRIRHSCNGDHEIELIDDGYGFKIFYCSKCGAINRHRNSFFKFPCLRSSANPTKAQTETVSSG